MIIKRPFDGLYDGKDVEEQLERYLSQLANYFPDGEIYKPETQKKKRVVVPDGYNIDLEGDTFKALPIPRQLEIMRFWDREKKRCIEGYGDMCGTQYQYYNYIRLHGGKSKAGKKGPEGNMDVDTDPSAGKDKVRYRRADNWLHELCERCIWGDLQGHGILLMGRRREGKSSKACNVIMAMMRRERNTTMVLSSKTEEDAERVLLSNKITFMYDRLPVPLKPKLHKRSSKMMHFGEYEEDDAGNRMLVGENNKIIAKGATSESIEGETVKAWVHDEALKTRNFDTLFHYTLPALADEEGMALDGFVMCLGVAGEESMNNGFINVWDAADTDNMIRVFLPGWYGVEVDEYGNENISKGVRRILQYRNDVWNDPNMSQRQKEKKVRIHQQQYPLTVQESIASASLSKWDDLKIQQQANYLRNQPDPLMYGVLDWEVKGRKVVWYPDSGTMNIQILELPQPGKKYLGGCDVYGLRQKDIGSKGVGFIWKMENPELSPAVKHELMMQALATDNIYDRARIMCQIGDLPVAMYIEDHKDPHVFGEGLAQLCNFYSTDQPPQDICKLLVENAPSNVKNYFTAHYPWMLHNQPLRRDKVPTQADLDKIGLDKKDWSMQEMLDELGWMVNFLMPRIFFNDLVTKLPTYDESMKSRKWDEVDAMGNTLLMRADPRIQEWAAQSYQVERKKSSIFQFRRR